MIRVFFWLLELGALFLLGSVAFLVMSALGRSFSGVLRAAASVVVAGAMSLAAGMGVGVLSALGDAGDPVGNGLITAIVALPLSLWLLDRSSRRRNSVPERDGALTPRLAEPASDEHVATAWSRAVRLAPLQRQRIASARAACAYVLNWAETHPFDMDTVECAVLIRKRLPELVDQTHTYCQLADRAERRTVVDGMVGDLESLGGMAMRRVERAKAQLGDSLAATRAHIASRTGEEVAF